MNIQFILLFVLVDVLLFPRRDNPGLFWRLLFSYWIGTNGRKLYYIFRPLQFILGAAGLYFTFNAGEGYNWFQSAAYLFAFVLYVTDLWYYVFDLELNTLFGFERDNQDTFWLEHFYQIGHYTWKRFSLKQFLFFSILGTILLVISNLI